MKIKDKNTGIELSLITRKPMSIDEFLEIAGISIWNDGQLYCDEEFLFINAYYDNLIIVAE